MAEDIKCKPRPARRIFISSSNVIRSFLPLDRYKVRFVGFDNPNRLEIIKESDTVMFSLIGYTDYQDFCNIYSNGILKDKEVVVGGIFLNILKNPKDFLDYFNVDYLCLGKGERFLELFFKNRLIKKIYFGDNSISQFESLIENKKAFRKLPGLSLLLNYQCRWNKCLFCHHGHDLGKDIDSIQLRKIIEEIIYKGRVKRLDILDNEVDINFVIENILEDKKLMSRLKRIWFFGIRCTPLVKKLESYVKRYKDTVFDLNLGFEFVSQPFIDLYKKGYNLKNFLKENNYLFKNNYKNLIVKIYCLTGMPRMNRGYYHQLENFIRQHQQIYFKGSYFLMDDVIIKNFNGFDELEILDNIKLNEFNYMENTPGFKTIYKHFLDRGRSQYDHFSRILEPSGLLKHNNLGINACLYPFMLPDQHLFNSAIKLYTRRRYRLAIKEANRVVELNYQGKKNIHLLLGLCYEKSRQYRQAIAELQKAERIGPGEPQVNFSLSRCYRKVNQFEQANQELEKGYLKLKRKRKLSLTPQLRLLPTIEVF